MERSDEPAGDRAGTLVRRARSSDLPGLGRLGALLVEAHHALDAQRFLAPTDRTPGGYASFLGTKLEDAPGSPAGKEPR